MELRKEFQEIAARVSYEYEKERINAIAAIGRVALACQELADRPMKELTDAEIQAISDKVEFSKFADDLLFARSCIAAHIAKQREPETVTFRAARLGDSVQMFQVDPPHIIESRMSPWEWLDHDGKPQTFEVKV